MRRRRTWTTALLTGSVCALAALPALGSTDRAQVFRGIITVDSDATGRVLVALDAETPTLEIDGTADHLFILQRELPATEIRIPQVEADLVFKGDELWISAADGIQVTLAVSATDEASDSEGDPPAERRRAMQRARSLTEHRIEGFGLAHIWDGLSGSPLDVIAEETIRAATSELRSISQGDFVCGPMGGGSENNVSCNGGGCGAESCNVSGCYQFPTSCGVSCQSGYFACCQCPTTSGASCKCYDNELCSSC